MTDQIDMNRINALLDREEIRALRLRYSQLLDGNQADRMGEVFTEDAEVRVTVGAMKGVAEIKASLKAAYQTFDTKGRGHFPFMHAVTNHEITLLDDNTASGSCYLLDLVTDRDATQHPILLLGHYLDRYVRVQGQWRIASSVLDVVWPDSAH